MFLCAAHNSWAQSSSGSTYSIFGLGELQSRASVQSRGMGFTSIGLSSPYWVNTVNYAANTQVGGYYTHIFDVGLYYNNISRTTDDGSAGSVSDGGISNLSFWFRFNNKWTGIVGISPVSKVGYDITVDDVETVQGRNYTINYVGSGGLNELYFSQGYELVKNLTLGARLSFILGSLKHEENALSGSSSLFSVTEKVSVRKVNVDFALDYKFQREKYAINLGLIYDDKTDLTGNSTRQLVNDADAELVYEESETENGYQMPQKVGLGLSFVNEKWILAGDVEFNQWSDVEIGSLDDINDTWRYSVGVDFTPNRRGERYTDLMSYRMGYYIENSYMDIDDTSFNTWGVTAGLGLPLKSDGAINLAYHRKVNGTTSNHLIKETTNEISLAISFRNLWFNKIKYQ
ncbi:hypothetical protein LVD15_20380 [Fulvivirga maritima]|uniref:hypothetical protein n=1 Tax=Fulvivirga maritima TaxID=2904247 RepID=UPI001F3582D9|nr:hypothetical protein [Fulvivirga maritima]UII25640.1 hypothetical protein LVD15_20380 [Fulvivirga maritima]